MNIVHVGKYNLANVPYMLSKAINHFTDHESRFIEFDPTFYYDNHDIFEKHGSTQFDYKGAEEVLKNADVIVWHELYSYHEMLEKKLEYNQDAKHVFFAHGTNTRMNFENIKKWIRDHKAKVVCSTPDLTQFIGGSWLPSPLDIMSDDYMYVHRNYDPEDLYISHSPTNQEVKGTHTLLEALDSPVSLWKPMLIQKTKHSRSMLIRANCVAHLDQLKIGAYGMSAVEGLAIGQVVLVNINPTFYPEWFMKTNPFFNVKNNVEDLTKTLLNMQENPEHLEIVGVNGSRWVRNYHNPKHIAKEFIKLIE